jgi:signal peptide peptidase SppA
MKNQDHNHAHSHGGLVGERGAETVQLPPGTAVNPPGDPEPPKEPQAGPGGRSVWALAPDVVAEVRAFLSGQWSEAQVEARVAETLAATQEAPSTGGAVAIIPLVGVLTPRPSLLSMLFGGGGGLQAFREDLAAAVNDPRIETIVLNVDSPGGSSFLIPETAAEVRQAAESKRVIAVANVRIASGAYWIASQADEIVVTPSGDVGSIGVLTMHEDVSKAEEMMGLKTTVISAGKYKAEGHPFEPLSDEARAELQKLVDDVYAMFVDDVAQGRGTTAEAVRSGYGQGRLQLANDAVASGLADRVDTIDSALEQLGAVAVTNEPEAATTRQAVADLLLPS